MNDYISTIKSSMSVGQKQVLSRFLDDAKNNRLSASPEAITAALNVVGSLLSLPNTDLTNPEGYNSTLATISANIAGLYQECDLLESIQNATEDLNTSELNKTEVALRDLQSMLDTIRAANAANTQYSDVFFETFGSQVHRETDQSWYNPIPILAASGQVNSYLPLFIDPDDRNLKLFPGGDFSRTTNVKGDRLAQVEVEEILGLSSDPNHPITQALDNNFFSYWGETILSDQPIDADPLLVSWLPITYQGGAAARLHFRFPFSIPFTEVLIRPFSKFPVHALQVVWDNRKIAVANLLTDSYFSSGTTYWTTGGTTANTISFFTAGGFDNVPYVNVQSVSGRTTLQSNLFTFTSSRFAYHFVFRINRQYSIQPKVLVEWRDTSSNLIRADWYTPDLPVNQWYESSRLFIAPSGITSGWTGLVIFVIDGSGSCSITQTSFSQTVGSANITQQQDLVSDNLSVQLANVDGQATSFAGTDLWLVLSQPHYEFLQLSIPQGELDKQSVWSDVRLQVDVAVSNVISTDTTLFSLIQGDKSLPPAPLSEDGSTLLKEVLRLGGRVRDLVVSLVRLATPDPTPVTVNKYLYLLGAWEIQVKHREYAPQGLFVSLPYKPRGEVRQLEMITDPPLSSLLASGSRVRFWITAREKDKTDRAKLFTGRATFSSSTESVVKRADTHFSLSPVTITETFSGTDREHRVALTNHPYADRDRIWVIQSRLTSGFTSTPLSYDPNKDPVYFLTGAGVVSTQGYRPIRVTLHFADGSIARPDLLGKIQPGDISLQETEILAPATITQEFSFLDQATQKAIDSKVAAASPSDRQDLRARLVQEALAKQQFGGGQNAGKRSQTVQLTALQTKFKKIVSGANGAALSLYWHKGKELLSVSGALAIHTSGDVLVPPSRYTVDAQNGVIIVRDSQPNNNPQYDSFIAYYYYFQDEIGARAVQDTRDVSTLPVSGIDFVGRLPQTQLVTRNATDYAHGVVGNLRQSNTNDLDPAYYPVFEYIVDSKGRLIFADDLSSFGASPAQISVEYESLLITPRVIIEFQQKAINEFSVSTPLINSFSLYMSSRG